MGSPSAAMTGKYDGEGMWIPWPAPRADSSVGSAAGGPGGGSSAPPATTGTSRPSSPSAYFRCQKSSTVLTTGISSKFHGGGGDEVIHSTVRASQGSEEAIWPRRMVRITLA